MRRACVTLAVLACLAFTDEDLRLTVEPLLALAPTGVLLRVHVPEMPGAREVSLEVIGPVSSFSVEPCGTDGHWMRREIARLPPGEYLVIVSVYGSLGVLASSRQRFERAS